MNASQCDGTSRPVFPDHAWTPPSIAQLPGHHAPEGDDRPVLPANRDEVHDAECGESELAGCQVARRASRAVIVSFADKETRHLAVGRLDDLRVPRGDRLEALKGDRKGQVSIRVND